MFQTGYILSRRSDLIWFLGLPFVAVAIALASQRWLTAVALASVSLWITTPHHFAGWLRTYGIVEERRQWADRLIAGPIVLTALCLAGLKWAPATLALLVILWDHQHSLMQQHGFARIYDFKGGTGSQSTGRFDLALNWILFCNLLLTSPLLMPIIVRELHHFRLPVDAATIRLVQNASWLVTSLYLVAYAGHLVWCVRQGHRINPIKYVFIAASYFLWYFCAWQTANVLVYGIAHRLMHGLQYNVIVYWYLRRQSQSGRFRDGVVAWLVRPRNVVFLLLTTLAYMLVYQCLVGMPLETLGFGYVSLDWLYEFAPALDVKQYSGGENYALFTAALINAVALTHYYFDSFIWKISDRRIQGGLT